MINQAFGLLVLGCVYLPFVGVFIALVLIVIEPLTNKPMQFFQPTDTRLIYKADCGFLTSFSLSLMMMSMGLLAVFITIELLQSLIQHGFLNFKWLHLLGASVCSLALPGSFWAIADLDLNRTTTFDRDRQKITIRRQMIFRKKVVERSLWDVNDVRPEYYSMNDDGSCSYRLAAIFCDGTTISLDSMGTYDDIELQTSTKRIRDFLFQTQ
jgi:hypothetical protein